VRDGLGNEAETIVRVKRGDILGDGAETIARVKGGDIFLGEGAETTARLAIVRGQHGRGRGEAESRVTTLGGSIVEVEEEPKLISCLAVEPPQCKHVSIQEDTLSIQVALERCARLSKRIFSSPKT
jgi:hypothetical protein